jgi:hypothetical protein
LQKILIYIVLQEKTMTDGRNDYIETVEKKLEQVDVKIARLHAIADQKTGDANREIRAKLGTIRDARQRTNRQLEELRLASNPAWDDARLGVEHAWKSLSDSVNRTSERYL